MSDVVAKDRQKYDAIAKELLSHKEVAANILKYAVKEFRDYSIAEIISCLNGKPEIGNEPVDDDLIAKMDIVGSEANSAAEGLRVYDIKFKVKTPDKNNTVELIINLESQHNYYPGYTLEKRGIYYLSRMISSQYNIEFTGSDFDKLKKVYSIWICTHAPSEAANTITEYRFKPEYIVGNIPDRPSDYDLMSLIMINLGSKDKNYSGLIKMLDTLLNVIITDKKKALDILEHEFNIPLLTIQREADTMCNLSMGVFNDGFDKGFDKGIEKGIEKGIDKGVIKNAINVVGRLLAKSYTLDEALEIAGIDKTTYEQCVSSESKDMNE